MKKILLAPLLLCLAFGIWANGSADNGADGKARIGVMVPSLQMEFFVHYSEGIKKALESEGYEVQVTGFDNDSNKAISIVENYTIMQYDAIIAMVSDRSVDSALKVAMDQGVKVIVPGVETAYYDLCLLADNKDVGVKIAEMASEFANEKLSGQAKVVAIIGTSSTDMADRSNMMVDTFKKLSPNSTIVGTAEYRDVGDGAAAVENFLQQYPDINIIMSYGDTGALEAVEVFKAAGKAGDNVAMFGCDATQQGLANIASEGIFRGTVSMGDIIQTTFIHTMKLMENAPDFESKIFGTNVKVTKDNISDYYNK